MKNSAENKYNFNLPMVIIPNDWVLMDTKANALQGWYLHNKDNYNSLITKNRNTELLNIK